MAGRAARAACVSSPCGRGRGHEAASAGGEDPVGGGLDVFVVSGMFVDQVDWYSMGPHMTMGNFSHGTISMVFQPRVIPAQGVFDQPPLVWVVLLLSFSVIFFVRTFWCLFVSFFRVIRVSLASIVFCF